MRLITLLGVTVILVVILLSLHHIYTDTSTAFNGVGL